MKIRFLSLLLLLSLYARAQESNYANYDVGANATMLGGAVVAGIDNISSAYYNPGALPFIKRSSVSLETSTLFTGRLNIANGAGENINIKSTFFDVIPSLIGGIVKSKKNPDWTFAYSAITVNSSLIEFNVRHFMVSDVIASNPGDEYYDGGYDYRNKISENWLGISAGRAIGEKFGVGVTLFATSFNQDFQRNQLALVTGTVNGSPETLASTNIAQYMRFRSLGMVLKAGLNYQFKNNQLGLTLTSPNLNIDAFAKGTISSNLVRYSAENGGQSNSRVFYGEDRSTYHRSPLKVALGYQYLMASSFISFKLVYYSPVKEYNMVTSERVAIPEVGVVRPEISAIDKANQVFNFAVGYRNDISEGFSLLLGAKTDFNFVDSEFLNREEFIPKMSYWNLYHATGGVIWYNNRAHLTLGADYAFGLSRDDLQQVNLSDPVFTELYFGEKTTNTRTFHNQVYIVFGFMFKFLE
jgi:hypothetical protein